MTVSAPVDRMDLRMTARVAARTSVFAAGEVVTVVFFQLEDEPTPVGVDACLRALVEGYAGFSNDDTWRRTRWFARMGVGPVQELKLCSRRPRHVWLLQQFDLANDG